MLDIPSSIKMVITDFDGIITDNCVYIGPSKEQTRKLNFKDIMGFSLLKKNNYKIAIISGEANSAIDLIAEKFQLEDIHQGIRNKIEVLESILKKYNLKDDEFIYIGDDVNDYDSLLRSKYRITVPSAVDKILNIPNIQITTRDGGCGAFREVVDTILGDL